MVCFLFLNGVVAPFCQSLQTMSFLLLQDVVTLPPALYVGFLGHSGGGISEICCLRYDRLCLTTECSVTNGLGAWKR